ncbi:MAG: phage tail tube protein [Proteobacteria bacterium]|nr:phage tail tube protein [Pseudomonadota bacterium]
MANGNRRGGKIYLKKDGVMFEAVGEFSYNLGISKRNSLGGADLETQGYSEEYQENFIEGAIRDSADLDLKAFLSFDDATVTLELITGKTVVQSNAWYAGDGSVKTKEGEIAFRSVGRKCEVS